MPPSNRAWKQIERRLDLPHIVAAVSRLRGEAWEDFGQRRGDWGRAMVPMAARRWGGIDNRTLAEWMGGKDDSAVTQAVKRLEAKMQASAAATVKMTVPSESRTFHSVRCR